MMKHTKILNDLYGYIAGELPAAERANIERHLADCSRCKAECDALRRSAESLRSAVGQPALQRSDAYWEGFAAGVEQRIQSELRNSRLAKHSFWEELRAYLALHRTPVLAAGAACILLVAGLYLLRPSPGMRSNDSALGPDSSLESSLDSPQVVPASERLERYLRRSKILLVGITNMKPSDGQAVDLRAEREASRSLIQEARYLQGQDIDGRSARLIGELNKILIELANLEEKSDVPDVEIIRGGIQQENLLFKIRMAEVLNDSSYANHDETF